MYVLEICLGCNKKAEEVGWSDGAKITTKPIVRKEKEI
jgi:hypothetical protein